MHTRILDQENIQKRLTVENNFELAVRHKPEVMFRTYFGTNLTSTGPYITHFVRKIKTNGEAFEIGEALQTKDIPFDLENLTNNLSNVEVHWIHSKNKFKDLTICAIAGSCRDKRPGSKSIFWIHENIPFEEMKTLILNTPICKKIIDNIEHDIIW